MSHICDNCPLRVKSITGTSLESMAPTDVGFLMWRYATKRNI